MTTVASIDDYVDALIAAGPDWVGELRREALTAYRDLPYPQGREEHWRFTDVKAIDPASFQPLTGSGTPVPADAMASLALAGVESAGRIVHGDGVVATLELSDEARKAGVVLTDLRTALTDHADVLRPRLGSLVGRETPHTALSLAAFDNGTFLYIPKGVTLTDPFQAMHWLSPDVSGSVVMPRTVIVVEDGADVVFNDLYASPTMPSATLTMPTTELFVGAGARVGWVTWQDWGAGVRQVSHVRAHLDRDALLNTLLVTLGGDFSRTWKECTLAGQGSQSYMYGLYFSHGDQRFEHYTLQDHVAPHATSDLLYKGALADSSQALYYGTIRIRPGAYASDAYQANRNLALSEHARALPNPQLEIENNDVRCTHGATVGQLDPNHIFYLRSRGIPEEQARQLVVFGFFNQVLSKVEWSGMHDLLGDAIGTKMEGV